MDSPTRDGNILLLGNVTDNLPSTDQFASMSISIPTQFHCRRALYNYTIADFNVFREGLLHIPWNVASDGDDVEYSWCPWKDLFFSTVSECIPTIKLETSKNKTLV